MFAKPITIPNNHIVDVLPPRPKKNHHSMVLSNNKNVSRVNYNGKEVKDYGDSIKRVKVEADTFDDINDPNKF